MPAYRLSPFLLVLAAVASSCTQAVVSEPGPPATGTASPEPFTLVAAAGDIACSVEQRAAPSEGSCAEKKTSDLLLAMNPEWILAPGDIQYENGSLRDFRAVFHPTWGRLGSRVRPAPGNHDYGVSGARAYFEYFGTAAGPPGLGYYSFDAGDWHIVSLNSNCSVVPGGCGANSPQVRWLRNDLAANRTACTLAYWHHPRFSSGLHGNDVRVESLWRTLYEAGADVVLAGHDHHYERFAPQDVGGGRDDERGIRQFIVGTGGRNLYGVLYGRRNSEFRSSRYFGVTVFELRPDSYTWRFVDTDGVTRDSGTDRCH